MENTTEYLPDSQTDDNPNGTRKGTSILDLPLEILLQIKDQLRETGDRIDLLCAALVNKGFWELLNGADLAPQARELWQPWFTLRTRGLFVRSPYYSTRWWKFLRRLERDSPSLRCCSGCLVMHPVEEFPVDQLEVADNLRICSYGPLVGVLDFCPCFRLTFRKKLKLVRALEKLRDELLEEEREEDGSVSQTIHECFVEAWPPNSRRLKDRLMDKLHFRCLEEKTIKKTRNCYTYAASFWIPELGHNVPWYSPHCRSGQRVDKQFKARLDAGGNFYIESRFKGISYSEEPAEYRYEWTPLHNQLHNHQVFICPHRALITLMKDLFNMVFNDEGGECDWHGITEEDAEENVKPLLNCKFCDTRVVSFNAKRWQGRGPCTYNAHTVRNLGKALDKADEVWFAQSFFSSVQEGDDTRERSPWKSRCP